MDLITYYLLIIIQKGQLGLGNYINSNIPLLTNLANIKTISALSLFSVALDNNGQVFTFGNNFVIICFN